MTKAFNPSLNSTEGGNHANAIDISAPLTIHSHDRRDLCDSNVLNNCLKVLQNENRFLKELIEQKETLLFNLTKTSDEERLKYRNENNQLKQTLKQLEIENSQLKARCQSNI